MITLIVLTILQGNTVECASSEELLDYQRDVLDVIDVIVEEYPVEGDNQYGKI